MTPETKYLIGPFSDGLRKDLKPFAQIESSFAQMTNAYNYLSRVRRRMGYRLLGRLQQVISAQIAAASAQNFSNNLFTTFSIASTNNLVPGSMLITVNGGANYTLQEDPANPGSIIQVSGAGVQFLNGNINYLTSVLTLNFSANPGGNVVVTFAYASNLPVMGLRTRDLFVINSQNLIGFDTRLSYLWSNTLQQFDLLPSTMPVVWSGTDSDFFFTTNYANSFWATNNKAGFHGTAINGISNANPAVVTTTAAHGYTTGQYVTIIGVVGYTPIATTTPSINGQVRQITVITPTTFSLTGLDGTLYGVYGSGGYSMNSTVSIAGQDGIRYYPSPNNTTWVNYNPPLNPTTVLVGALMMFAYRGYFIFLNTKESDGTTTTTYGNRMRWTQVGTPYYSNPVPPGQIAQAEAVRDDIFGRGGAEDAPTNQIIIGAEFIRDILIVYFQNSTWRIRFTANTVSPFVWERVNVEFGSQSTFSTIPFDKGLMAVGSRGIIISDGNDTVRFDEKIPEEIFDIRNKNDGQKRVYGIRSFENRLCFWTFPSGENSQAIYPDKVLVYNYDKQTWSFFDDTFTCYGNLLPFFDATWADLEELWPDCNFTWTQGPLESFFEYIVAGNQQGFVETINPEVIQNDVSLNITALTAASPAVFTSVAHNLKVNDWVKLSGIAGTLQTDSSISGGTLSLNGRNFRVARTPTADTFVLEEFSAVNAGDVETPWTTFTGYLLAAPYIPIFPKSVLIYVGTLTFTDPLGDGILVGSDGTSSGAIDYKTGQLTLIFSPALVADTPVIMRFTSYQPFDDVDTTGTYTGGGYITKISNMSIQSKVFNFFKQDKKARLSKIDFYLNRTSEGEFICDVFGDSNTSIPINNPFPQNPRTNVVLTRASAYQIQGGNEVIYRLFCDAVAQTIQLQFRLSDQQMSLDFINSSDIQLESMIMSIKPGGRLI